MTYFISDDLSVMKGLYVFLEILRINENDFLFCTPKTVDKITY